MLYVVCVYIVISIAVMILAPPCDAPAKKFKKEHEKKIDQEFEKEEK